MSRKGRLPCARKAGPGGNLALRNDTMVGVLGRMGGRTYPRLEAEVGHLETPKGQHMKVPTEAFPL